MRWMSLFLLSALAVSAQQSAESPKLQRATDPPKVDSAKVQEAGLPRGTVMVPSGTQIPLKLEQGISTKSAKVGDAVYAKTVFPITQNDRIVIPAGTYVQGRIARIQRPGRVKGRAEFLMNFTTMVFKSGYTVMLPGEVENLPGSEKQTVKDGEGTVRENGTKGKDAETVAKTAGTGATVGAIVDRSWSGAGIGGAAGAAAGLGYVLLTRGPDVNLPVGTSVQMVLARDLTLETSKIR